MKVKVVNTFADKITHEMYSVGQILEFDDARAEDMISRGLVDSLEVKSVKEKKKVAKKKED